MSGRIYREDQVSLFTLIIAFFAILAQASTAHAQTSANEQARDLSQQRFFDATRPDKRTRANTGPALLALSDVAGAGTAAGGLWLSGDAARALAHLRWIAGDQPPDLLNVDGGGKVSFDLRILVRAAGVTKENAVEQRERIATFVRSDEGLRLLAEVMYGAYSFLLHIGHTAPTLAGNMRLVGVCNLDNRFDNRINPRRQNGKKLDKECPPKGFDSMIAINPDARWFNIYQMQFVPMPQITFHELAEAQARVALELDYLPQRDKPGAHNVAIDREIKLKQGRPEQYVIMPIGRNYLLASRGDRLRQIAELQKQGREERNRFLPLE